jgi:hypothetical protein
LKRNKRKTNVFSKIKIKWIPNLNAGNTVFNKTINLLKAARMINR